MDFLETGTENIPKRKHEAELVAEVDAGAKRGKIADSEESTATKPKSHCDLYFERLGSLVEGTTGALRSVIIQGIARDDDDDEDEDDVVDNDSYTEEQVNNMRHVIITSQREKALHKAADFFKCGQTSDGIMMFNTHHGNQVVDNIPREVAKIMKKKTLPERFDHLFALTYKLEKEDFWMNDNEYGEEIEDEVGKLAKAWKTLMAKTDAELGIDSEFTRKGIEALLDKFASSLKDVGAGNCTFPWK